MSIRRAATTAVLAVAVLADEGESAALADAVLADEGASAALAVLSGTAILVDAVVADESPFSTLGTKIVRLLNPLGRMFTKELYERTNLYEEVQ